MWTQLVLGVKQLLPKKTKTKKIHSTPFIHTSLALLQSLSKPETLKMPAASDNYKLLFALISQTEIKSIDWDRVAREIGVPTKMAAQKRWQRLKQTEGLSPGGTPTVSLVPLALRVFVEGRIDFFGRFLLIWCLDSRRRRSDGWRLTMEVRVEMI